MESQERFATGGGAGSNVLGVSDGSNAGDFESDELFDDFSSEELDDFSSEELIGDTADDDILEQKSPAVDIGHIINTTVNEHGVLEKSISPDDLQLGVFVSDDQDDDSAGDRDDQDLVEFYALYKELSDAGYSLRSEDEATYADLDILAKREKKINSKQDLIALLINNLGASYQETTNLLAASKATYEIQASDRDAEKLKLLFDSYASDMQVARVAMSSIGNFKNIDEVTPEDVFVSIRNNPSYNEKFSSISDESLLSILQCCVPVLKEHDKMRTVDEERSDSKRARVATYLLKDVGIHVAKIYQANQRGDVKFIKQVITKDTTDSSTKVFIKCPHCEQLYELKESPVFLSRFPTEAGRKIAPFYEFCECDHCKKYGCFTANEYNKMIDVCKKEGNASIQTAVQHIDSISHGAGILKWHPPVTMILDAIKYLVHEDAEVITTKVDTVTETVQPTMVSNSEFMNAVAEFYRKLSCVNAERTASRENANYSQSIDKPSSLTDFAQMADSVVADSAGVTDQEYFSDVEEFYRVVAMFFAQTLSMNYVSLRNQALFSLFFFFKEHAIFDDVLNIENIIYLRNTLSFIESNRTDHAEKLPFQIKAYLRSLASDFFAEVDLQGKSEAEIVKMVLENQRGLQNQLDQLKVERAKLIEDVIVANRNALAYCPIINLNSFKVSDILEYVTNSEELHEFERIADMMIINNYADKFFNEWILFCPFNRTDIKKVLFKSSASKGSIDRIKKMLDKTVAFANANSIVVTKELRKFTLPLIDLHSVIRKADKAIKHNDVYGLCAEVADFPMDLVSFMSDTFDESFMNAATTIKDYIEKSGILKTSKWEYYLPDFSKEELEPFMAELEALTFNYIVPKRVPGETVPQYISRYNQLITSTDVRAAGTFRVVKIPKELINAAQVIAIASGISSITYHSYSAASFIRSLVHLLSYSCSKSSVKEILGLTGVVRTLLEMELSQPDLTKEIDTLSGFFYLINGLYFSGVEDLIYDISNNFASQFVEVDLPLHKSLPVNLVSQRLDEIAKFATDSSAEVTDGSARDENGIYSELLLYSQNDTIRELVEEVVGSVIS